MPCGLVLSITEGCRLHDPAALPRTAGGGTLAVESRFHTAKIREKHGSCRAPGLGHVSHRNYKAKVLPDEHKKNKKTRLTETWMPCETRKGPFSGGYAQTAPRTSARGFSCDGRALASARACACARTGGFAPRTLLFTSLTSSALFHMEIKNTGGMNPPLPFLKKEAALTRGNTES